MNAQLDQKLKIKTAIARRIERIARWDSEADNIETAWTGGPEYRRFCQGMASAAREKKTELEAELQQLHE